MLKPPPNKKKSEHTPGLKREADLNLNSKDNSYIMMTPEDFVKILEANNTKNNEVLKQEIKESFKKELTDFKADMKTMVENSLASTNSRIANLEAAVTLKDDEIATLKEDVSKMRDKAMSLEFVVRKKNFVLFRVSEEEGEKGTLLNGVSKLIREVADSSFTASDIDEVYRLGKMGRNPRPIMVILNKSSKRNFILAQKRKFMEKNIGIAEDLPKEVVEFRRPLYPLADSLRKDGKRVTFRMNKLLVDGKELSPEEIAVEEATHERKRKLSESPEEVEPTVPKSTGATSKRPTLPRLNLASLETPRSKLNSAAPETPRSQTSMEKFFSPNPTKNSKSYEFVSND